MDRSTTKRKTQISKPADLETWECNGMPRKLSSDKLVKEVSAFTICGCSLLPQCNSIGPLGVSYSPPIAQAFRSQLAAGLRSAQHASVNEMAAETECIIIGPDGCGKSLLVKRIKEVEAYAFSREEIKEKHPAKTMATQATIGMDLIDVTWKGKKFKIRELGAAISSRWSAYYGDCHALIFVVDMADMGLWATALTQLYECASYTQLWMGKPALLVLNKADITDISSQRAVVSFLALDSLRHHMSWSRLDIMCGNGVGGELSASILDWMASI